MAKTRRAVTSAVSRKIKEADNIIEEMVEQIDEQLEKVQRMLAPYEKLKERENKLRASRRALLGGTRTTGEGGTKIRQEDIVEILKKKPGSSPDQIAKELGTNGAVVRSHLYRGKDERFLTNGDKRWWARDPKEGLNTADDIPEEE